MNLEEMVERASCIATGTCTGAEATTALAGGANLAATRYTFAVDEAIQGVTASTVSFEQFGERGTLAGLPDFVPGERYLLLISPPERPGGLTTTVGLDQGAFLFVAGEDGESERLLNGRANMGLFDGLSPAARARGVGEPDGVDASSLLRAVRTLAESAAR